ncbi:bifunctional pantoate--beta-alanine ligase/(d)CMP kinase [Oscillatoria sp. CS-180]|uniref:bifunctional pantoate--beta-alanine ligase/(d)CMP kinase n=1 Tax=Oscillatoria sp. CS-180 TaxID=3021720 RepID=UPI00232BCC67|nr:bifunctional pantoate--beta-alanine ligase/(d)CMP kinase [Oscillatoria sp. CS-180]MDB9528464.1 bifunctional pantoate--beta-alanine ligase/(d)CMP kinase [Oscillatoria sp. CS-180]
MKVLKTIEGLRSCLAIWRQPSADDYPAIASIGLVPTMGALHAGHMSLIHRARQENDRIVVSIFVNPLQFGPTEDLEAYPRMLDNDLAQCEAASVDAIFCPLPHTLYPQSPNQSPPFLMTQVIPVADMMRSLCGAYRPGHFSGVTTVVAKLFNLVAPERAYFGQKDAQQLAIIKQMVRDLNWPVTVVGCPIIREADGLAHSSRNRYLSQQDRQHANVLYQSLNAAKTAFMEGEKQGQALINIVKETLSPVPSLRVQYIELVHPETLEPVEHIETVGLLAIAAYLGDTRLIDNVLLRSRRPIVAIDGPAGAGKSTVARLVADKLGLMYLDSGAMYRAITWKVLESNVDPADEIAVAEILADCQIRLATEPATQSNVGITRVWVNDQDVTHAIRSPDVTGHVSTVAAQPVVREVLLKQQQAYGEQGGVVMEGRDIGTQVFPFAELKVFLTASVHERARRRQKDMAAQNQPPMSLEALQHAIDERDHKDSTRTVAPLRQAKDAVELFTDGLSIEAVVEKIVGLYRQRLEDDQN